MKITTAVLALVLSFPLFADSVEEVRQAEIGFAKAFADRDPAKFFSYVADDAVFLSQLGAARGKTQVIERWSRFFDKKLAEAPFSWGPERVEVMDGGKSGYSSGPIFSPDGKHLGYFASFWQKDANGAWKVVFDGAGSPPPAFKDEAVPEEEGFVDADGGAKLYYRKTGAGPITIIAPLDFIFHDPLKMFADIATVITYDARNRGRSSRVDVKTMSIEQDVRDLEAVRAQLKVETFVPVGYSYLGKMVVLYAAAHPARVRRVVQLSPAGNVPHEVKRDPNLGVSEADQKKLDEVKAKKDATSLELCEANWNVMRYGFVGNPKYASRVTSPCAFENERWENFGPAFQVLWPTALQPMSDADVAKVTMPVLVIHGTKDRNASYEDGKAWAKALPDARLLTVENAAHATWADDPVVVLGAIRHFLRGEWPLGGMNMR
ncbi:MAG TPA: alpha/beta fold hydrolase [Thermoanaerobaculia bacterium]|nr:alpha/beta fold hydrolase [Thermoanaerobaculia bacterium]